MRCLDFTIVFVGESSKYLSIMISLTAGGLFEFPKFKDDFGVFVAVHGGAATAGEDVNRKRIENTDSAFNINTEAWGGAEAKVCIV